MNCLDRKIPRNTSLCKPTWQLSRPSRKSLEIQAFSTGGFWFWFPWFSITKPTTLSKRKFVWKHDFGCSNTSWSVLIHREVASWSHCSPRIAIANCEQWYIIFCIFSIFLNKLETWKLETWSNHEVKLLVMTHCVEWGKKIDPDRDLAFYWHPVEWLILLLKQNDLSRRRNEGCKSEQFFI